MVYQKNRGAVWGVANQSAVFQISTNQKAVFGPRDFVGREVFWGVWVGAVLGPSVRGGVGNRK